MVLIFFILVLIEIYRNTIAKGNTGIYVSSNSINNIIKDNIFSSNNQKILEELHIEETSNLPCFEFILINHNYFYYNCKKNT